MGKDLPKGWEESILDSIVEKMTNGANLKQSEVQHHNYFPITRIETIANESIDLNRVKYVEVDTKTKEKYRLQRGDILFSHINSDKHLGKTAIFEKDIDIIHGVNLLLIRANDAFDKKLLNYLFKYYRGKGEFLLIAQRAVNQSSINQKKLKQVKIPVPPLSEQKRIVAKLDALFEHLEVLKAKLDRIPELLKNFRQSVLTQAVTGKLTEEWRERKGLGEWEEVELQDIAKIIDPQPSHRTPPIHPDAIPYISIGDVDHQGNIDFENARPVSKKVLAEHIKRYDLQEGDFAFGKIGTLGKPFKLPIAKDRSYTLSANIILIQPRFDGNPEFIYYYLNSSVIAKRLKDGAKSTSQPAFGIKKARVFPTPKPSREEQNKIVEIVQLLLKNADSIESQYKSLKEKINHLPQAILQKAFKGELVPQDPNDEPASMLLKRIKGEKISIKK
jgi:type I restriction enzyme S subunit